jgi:hypothetical protein
MALPKIDLPLNELTLPSNQQKVMYRPFTVKEEKILLVAAEAQDALVEMTAIKQVVNNCLFDIAIEDISMLDLEFVFLKLRATSVNNTAKFNINDPDTGESIPVEFDLDTIEIVRDPEHTKEVKVNDDLVLYLKYPNINDFMQIIGMEATDPLVNYVIMVSCLDTLATEDEVHNFSDYSEAEIAAFMDNMSGDIVKKISKFFETMPKLKQELQYTNSNGDEKTFVIEGMRSFFT